MGGATANRTGRSFVRLAGLIGRFGWNGRGQRIACGWGVGELARAIGVTALPRFTCPSSVASGSRVSCASVTCGSIVSSDDTSDESLTSSRRRDSKSDQSRGGCALSRVDCPLSIAGFPFRVNLTRPKCSLLHSAIAEQV
jgi:hypothetical protein